MSHRHMLLTPAYIEPDTLRGMREAVVKEIESLTTQRAELERRLAEIDARLQRTTQQPRKDQA